MTSRLFSKSTPSRKVGAALAVAAILAAPSAATADALAQGYLFVTDFKLTVGTPFTNGTVSGTGRADVELNGADASTGALSGQNYGGAAVLGAGYVAQTPILGPVSSTFAGGTTFVDGNAVTQLGGAGASALADSVVSLVPSGNGSSFTNTGTTFGFNFSLSADSFVEIEFNAESFLRAFLDGSPLIDGLATSRTTWGMTISKTCTNPNGSPIANCTVAPNPVFRWDPNGQAGGITGGTELRDDFSLNDGVTADPFFREDSRGLQTGSFAAKSNTLGIGRYSLTITHKVDSEAFVQVPEPGTLALVGLSLLGVGIVGRRRLSKTAA